MPEPAPPSCGSAAAVAALTPGADGEPVTASEAQRQSAARYLARAETVWDDARERLVSRGQLEDEAYDRELAEWEQVNERRAAALADTMAFLFALPHGAAFVPFKYNDYNFERYRGGVGPVQAYLQRVSDGALRNKGSLVLVAWASDVGQKKEGADQFQARERGAAVQALAQSKGIPSRVVVAPRGAAFHLTFETPGYRRTARVSEMVDAKFRELPDILEQQGVLMVYVDRRLAGMLRGDDALDIEEQPMPASVLGDREARVQAWQDLGRPSVVREASPPKYQATARQLRVEQAAFDACNAATQGDLRLLDSPLPGWNPLSVVSFAGEEWYGPADEAWAPDVRASARVESSETSLALELYDRADLEWLGPWFAAALLGQVDTLVPRDAIVPPADTGLARRQGGGIRLTVKREVVSVAVGKLRMSVRSPFAELGLRALYDLVHGADSVVVTRLGTLEFRARVPAAITELRRMWVVDVAQRDPANADPDLASAARTALTNLENARLARLSVLRVEREPIHQEYEVFAQVGDMEGYTDVTASDELARARGWVADGTYRNFPEAIAAAHPVSPFGTCVNKLLHAVPAAR